MMEAGGIISQENANVCNFGLNEKKRGIGIPFPIIASSFFSTTFARPPPLPTAVQIQFYSLQSKNAFYAFQLGANPFGG
jgi:hypothetical protein